MYREGRLTPPPLGVDTELPYGWVRLVGSRRLPTDAMRLMWPCLDPFLHRSPKRNMAGGHELGVVPTPCQTGSSRSVL